ncbi:MAG: hypothetical protein Q7S58_02250 [Candidatus Binatus sp.]|uniref:hypothetical protein n=1 Tax=Candidatus Binatus sp. TaxID=2811406 RepID=UPI002715D1E2|nr:hypothetical protein [Candidatus Binatus sp.]MDO8431212.1 hypothetical protein [Candidatus Binatus sp.]
MPAAPLFIHTYRRKPALRDDAFSGGVVFITGESDSLIIYALTVWDDSKILISLYRIARLVPTFHPAAQHEYVVEARI